MSLKELDMTKNTFLKAAIELGVQRRLNESSIEDVTGVPQTPGKPVDMGDGERTSGQKGSMSGTMVLHSHAYAHRHQDGSLTIRDANPIDGTIKHINLAPEHVEHLKKLLFQS